MRICQQLEALIEVFIDVNFSGNKAADRAAYEFGSGWLTAEIVVLLGREFGLGLWKRCVISAPQELVAILNELQRQVALEQYTDQRNKWAFLAAVITNGFGVIAGMFSKRKHKAVSPDDFMGKEAKKMLQQLLGGRMSRKIGTGILRMRKQRVFKGPW